MTVRQNAHPAVEPRPKAPGMPRPLGLLASVVVFAFVLSSSFVAILPAFRFESQFPALLPLFLWAAAAGLAHLATFGRLLLDPWRAAFGLASVAPWLLVLVIPTVAPRVALPWWAAVVAAVAAAAPFVVAGLRGGPRLELTADRRVSGQSLRGTFLVGVASMLMVWCVGGPAIVRTVMGVLLALALGIAALLPHGLAHATRSWGIRHWAAITWASLVVWVAVPLSVTTHFFDDAWYLAVTMVIAGLPLVLVNRADAQSPKP